MNYRICYKKDLIIFNPFRNEHFKIKLKLNLLYRDIIVMARGKKGRKSGVGAIESIEQLSQPIGERISHPKSRFAGWEYVLVCIFFIGFCYLQKFVAIKLLNGSAVEKLALDFFFDTLWKGFVIVAFLVWLHDFFYPAVEDVEEEDTA